MTRQRFYLKMAFGSLLRGRSRMAAALLGVGIGATILSGLISVGRDIPRQMGREFRSYGVNLVIVPAEENAALDGNTAQKALAMIPAESLTGAAPYRYRLIKINERPFMSAGTDFGELQNTNPWWFVLGNFPQRNGEVLIGREVADTIRLVSGSSFTVSGGGLNMDFVVCGIVQTGGPEEAFIFMSMTDFETMTGENGLADVIECSVAASGDSLRVLAESINAAVPGAAARRVLRLTESEDAVLGKLQALVFIVTAITLLLTMICVAATMMAVVAERRREIGLKKALGASNISLVLEFLGEGVLVGFLGGALGSGFGFLFAEAASQNIFSRALVFNPLLIPITIAVSVIITGIACLVPVRRAVEVDPAIVLRGE
jgi:putative ABC transport system permease protein